MFLSHIPLKWMRRGLRRNRHRTQGSGRWHRRIREHCPPAFLGLSKSATRKGAFALIHLRPERVMACTTLKFRKYCKDFESSTASDSLTRRLVGWLKPAQPRALDRSYPAVSDRQAFHDGPDNKNLDFGGKAITVRGETSRPSSFRAQWRILLNLRHDASPAQHDIRRFMLAVAREVTLAAPTQTRCRSLGALRPIGARPPGAIRAGASRSPTTPQPGRLRRPCGTDSTAIARTSSRCR